MRRDAGDDRADAVVLGGADNTQDAIDGSRANTRDGVHATAVGRASGSLDSRDRFDV